MHQCIYSLENVPPLGDYWNPSCVNRMAAYLGLDQYWANGSGCELI
jgi:hypothetical protein